MTTTSSRRYEELAQVMRNEPLDLSGIDYAIDNRNVEDSILPLAAERQIGVLVYLPFGRTRLWQRVADRELPIGPPSSTPRRGRSSSSSTC